MDSSTGIILGKVGFYLALIALVVVVIIKKRKQIINSRKNFENDQENTNL